jgi:hypothetical protein
MKSTTSRPSRLGRRRVRALRKEWRGHLMRSRWINQQIIDLAADAAS